MLPPILVTAFTACTEARDPADAATALEEYSLVVAQRFGWNELSDSTRPMTDRERLFSGAVLGRPTSILVDDIGNVFVADGGFQKIVVFSPDGDFLRLFIGGDGKGPGEFGLPGPVVFGPRGDLWVFDFWLQRLTRFSTGGRLIGTMPVPASITPRMLEFAATPEILYGKKFARDSVALLVAFDTLGNTLGEFVDPTADDVRFSRGRSLAAALGTTSDPHELIIAYPDVGTWSRIRGLTVDERRGAPLFPGAVPWPHTGSIYGITTIRVAAQAMNTGAFADGTTYIRFRDFQNTDDPSNPIERMALYDSTGVLLDVLDSVGTSGAFAHSPHERAFYTVYEDPYPHIVKLLLVANGESER